MADASEATKALLSDAFQKLAVAQTADNDLSASNIVLITAQNDVNDKTAADLVAHQAATASAHDALAALAKDLGYPLPTDFNPAPTSPPVSPG